MSLRLPRTDNPREVSNWRKNISTDSIVLSNNASNITHAATTGYFVVNALEASVLNFAAPAKLGDIQVTPTTADGANDNFYLPITGLPIGATVTKIEALGFTAGGGTHEVSVSLQRLEHTGNPRVDVVMATVLFGGGGSVGTSTTITSPVIGEGYSYYVGGAIKSDTAILDTRFYSFRITFTTVNLGAR